MVAVDFALQPNVAGCVALIQDNASPWSCAARIAATMGCEDAACSSCPSATTSEMLTYEQCVQEADVGACNSYLGAECDLSESVASQCLPDGSEASFVSFASVFCNPPAN